jgi:LacI family transcriptional regulator
LRRRPTIIDVANLAGVSKTTVARVVNGEIDVVSQDKRQRVLEAIEQLGYERNAIAGSLRSDRTNIIALSIPDITNPFWPEVARGVQDKVEKAGYTVALLNNDWDAGREHNHLQLMRRNLFDGLIINPTGISNEDLVKLKTPVVVLGSGEAYPNFDAVGSDTEQAAHLALEHLIELGHKRIGLIAGLSRRRKSRTRYDSYVDVHRKWNLPLNERLVVESAFTQEGGSTAASRLIRPPE